MSPRALRRLSAATALFVAGLIVPVQSRATDAADGRVEQAAEVAFGAKLVSDYVDRGFTNSDGAPAIQGYVEVTAFDWLYFGVWASSVRYPLSKDLTDPSAEIDWYGGVRRSWGAFSIDAGALYYAFPGESRPYAGARETDYYELSLKPGYVVGDALTLGGQLFWSGDYANTGSNAAYLAATARLDFTAAGLKDLALYISAEIGRQWFGRTRDGFDPADYLTWNVGAGASFRSVTLDVRYSGSDLNRTECLGVSGSRGWCGQRVMASVAFDTAFSALK